MKSVSTRISEKRLREIKAKLEEFEEKIKKINKKIEELRKKVEELRKQPHRFGYIEFRPVKNKIGTVYRYYYYVYYVKENGVWKKKSVYLGDSLDEKLLEEIERGKQIKALEREIYRLEKEREKLIKKAMKMINKLSMV